MTPDDILKPLLRRIELPPSVIKLLYLLFAREIRDGYPTSAYLVSKPPERIAAYYIEWLLWFFNRLPPFTDLDAAPFATPLWQLAGMSHEELTERTHPGSRAAAEQESRRLRKDEEYVSVQHDRFWDDLLHFNVSFDIKKNIRFEHTHCIATPGSGKTTLLMQLIHRDIQSNAAVIVMTPKGGMIDALSRLKSIDPDRLILVKPEEDYPIAINPFALKGGDAVVDLLKRIFDTIDTDTTPKQQGLLEYCLKLLLVTPNATILTLRDLLKSKEVPHDIAKNLSKLDRDDQDFFTKDFSDHTRDGYGQQKMQLMWRIRKVISKDISRNIFSQTENKIDMADVMAGGKVLLIDTDWGELGKEGSAFLGKLFVALIDLATRQRDKKKPLRAVHVYLDEAWHYLTAEGAEFLDTAREACVGLTLSHQGLDQLSNISHGLEQAVHRASTKIAGRCESKDARTMADQLHAEAIPRWPFQFLLYVSGQFGHTIPIEVKNGVIESLPKRSDEEQRVFLLRNRAQVSTVRSMSTPEQATMPKAAEPEKKYTPRSRTDPTDC